MNPRLWILVLILAVPVSAAGAGNDSKMTPLVVAGKSRCAIVVPPDDALTRRTAETLSAYLGEHAGAAPSIRTGADPAADAGTTWIVLDGTPGRRLLDGLGVDPGVPGDRADAYRLRVVRRDGRTIVAVAGRTPAGAKYGAYRLMEEMDVSPGGASVPDLDLSVAPFFKTRSVSLFNIWRVPVDVIRRCNLESWPAGKIRRNIDTYDAFGFNAVETHDRFHEDFLRAVYGITRDGWRDKVYALCDRAHENGMTVFLRQWGNSVALPVRELAGGYTPFGFDNLAPDLPDERKRWEAEIRDYTAWTYATHVDHLIGHWADAGGVHPGSGATIRDAMLLHNELRDAFRSLNPKIETSFNLWGMGHPKGNRGWPGYEDHRSITTAGVLARDVIVAQATRSDNRPYSETVAAEILADGYRTAAWTWRRGDTEVRFNDCGLRIRIHGVMEDYYRGLPESARGLEWHNIERNHHGLANDVNYYVAGRLMWDPRTDVDAALKKYCALVFGPANAEAVAGAFLAVEAGRDVERGIGRDILAAPAEGARRARRALAGLAGVRLAEGHRSRLPSVTSPQEMLDDLRGTLAVIAENADLCARQLPALDALLQEGGKEKAGALAADLRKQADAWSGTVAGGVEGLWLKETLEAKLDPEAAKKKTE